MRNKVQGPDTEAWAMPYDQLYEHIGHKIGLNDVWDWQTNRQSELEIRCADCDGEEPILTIDAPAR